MLRKVDEEVRRLVLEGVSVGIRKLDDLYCFLEGSRLFLR